MTTCLNKVAAEAWPSRRISGADLLATQCAGARQLYFELFDGALTPAVRRGARHFLQEQLAQVDRSDREPITQALREGQAWVQREAVKVGDQYAAYLSERREGGSPRFFPSHAHALHFLRGVAPTKLVDGSWLYGLLPRWRDARFQPLIRTYLEELGDGDADKNHVLLYRRLLATHDLTGWETLPDKYFVQGAIQLALAHGADEFLPEIIGYNLGYEQLPLHLLITAHELRELGIDPYYFTLHVTIDNASTGHANKALEGLRAALPDVGDRSAFLRRVANGYRLNDLGASSTSIIGSFDLQDELIKLLDAKAEVGRTVHSERCRIEGKTINEWLGGAHGSGAFLDALVRRDWIRRGEDVERSRFWRLLEGPGAAMFGVFNGYERQVLRAWIENDTEARQRQPASAIGAAPSVAQAPQPRSSWRRCRSRPRRSDEGVPQAAGMSEFDRETRALRLRLASYVSDEERMAFLAQFLAPHNHHNPAGLLATQLYCEGL